MIGGEWEKISATLHSALNTGTIMVHGMMNADEPQALAVEGVYSNTDPNVLTAISFHIVDTNTSDSKAFPDAITGISVSTSNKGKLSFKLNVHRHDYEDTEHFVIPLIDNMKLKRHFRYVFSFTKQDLYQCDVHYQDGAYEISHTFDRTEMRWLPQAPYCLQMNTHLNINQQSLVTAKELWNRGNRVDALCTLLQSEKPDNRQPHKPWLSLQYNTPEQTKDNIHEQPEPEDNTPEQTKDNIHEQPEDNTLVESKKNKEPQKKSLATSKPQEPEKTHAQVPTLSNDEITAFELAFTAAKSTGELVENLKNLHPKRVGFGASQSKQTDRKEYRQAITNVKTHLTKFIHATVPQDSPFHIQLGELKKQIHNAIAKANAVFNPPISTDSQSDISKPAVVAQVNHIMNYLQSKSIPTELSTRAIDAAQALYTAINNYKSTSTTKSQTQMTVRKDMGVRQPGVDPAKAGQAARKGAKPPGRH